ncbi:MULTISPECIES: hypothetical protein [Pseudoalteromonas]|uniref:DUF304 domain-containing protein n=1 Tax=Pseudoalteromonas rubra TaxID=43658 RepID=A0A5S3UQQ5_9GAMM|nr:MULTISPECIES: hypothetical protein [Pseudoalteromonas]MCG7562282.1 hypothetical protein [Pseudoalteromonas sp. McH1-42]QPB83845.1 hypothetical protein CWC22_012905 [Pseudoalteromonas rubra]
MNELKLEINTTFYCVVGAFVIALLALAGLFTELNLSFLATMQITIASVVSIAFAINFLLSMAGHKRVTLCNQGLSFFSLTGRQRYVPAENIQSIEFVNYIGLTMTQVKTNNGIIKLLAFRVRKEQQQRLKNLGYLA